MIESKDNRNGKISAVRQIVRQVFNVIFFIPRLIINLILGAIILRLLP